MVHASESTEDPDTSPLIGLLLQRKLETHGHIDTQDGHEGHGALYAA